MSAPHPQSRVTWTAYKGLSAAPSLPAASSLRALSSRARASALFSRPGDTWALLLFFFYLLFVCFVLLCYRLLTSTPYPPGRTTRQLLNQRLCRRFSVVDTKLSR